MAETWAAAAAGTLEGFYAAIAQSRLALGLGTALAVIAVSQMWRRMAKNTDYDPDTTDPPLLRDHSSIKSFSTRRFTYPKTRVFFRRHAKDAELPRDPAPLPLLVFVHGLGGSAAQFHPILLSLTTMASCLAVDLPGCGRSGLSPSDWAAYSTEALVELLDVIIEEHRDREAGQQVVLIAHSMGGGLAARLASRTVAKGYYRAAVADHVAGLVAMCPPAGPPSEKQTALFRKLLYIPGPIFDLWRAWDRRGGEESASVRRFVGADADPKAKRLQHMFNQQSRTPTWRRMAWGVLPDYKDGKPVGGLPGRETWAGLEVPVCLIAGASDKVTPASEAEKVYGYLTSAGGNGAAAANGGAEPIVDAAAPVDSSAAIETLEATLQHITPNASSTTQPKGDTVPNGSDVDPSTPSEQALDIPAQPTKPKRVIGRFVLPAPASHALLYAPSTARVAAGIISDFLSGDVTGRFSLGWQLQYLNREGKWDVKNLAKWEKVAPVSDGVAGGVFRALKTLREVDAVHCPAAFVADWEGRIGDVVDISYDMPAYDPRTLEEAGIRYHKFPTASKVPPTEEDTRGFAELIDRLREGRASTAAAAGDDEEGVEGRGPESAIGVHCHYGFNRTGYFIVCYLVDRMGYSTRDAIDEFARARPPGIRHAHFKDKLFQREAFKSAAESA